MSRSSSRLLRSALFVAGMILASSATLWAQPGQGPGGGGFGRGGFGGFGGPGGGFGGGPLMMLQRKDVQEELELLDDQKEQITAMSEKAREQMGELFRNARGGGGEGGDIRETFRKFNEEMQAEVDKILLPHQAKRLKQLETQMRMRAGVMGALGGDVAEQLGITEDQQEKLRGKAQELEQELRKKMAEVRKQMQDQLLAELSPEQRKQFNEMVGEPFEFRDEPPQGGFGGPGGRGRPDGGREGRGTDRRRRPE